MELFSQLDPRWAHEKIGNSIYKIGRWGCTITALCMVLSKLHPEAFPTPPEAARLWAFNKNGEILWALSEFKGMRFITRGYSNPSETIKKAAAAPDKGIIVEVSHSHWIACEGVENGKIVFHDPIDGTRSVDLPKNKGYTITGYALFEFVSLQLPVSEHAKVAVDKCIKSGVATGWDDPQHFVANSEAEIMLVRAGVFQRRELQGGVSKEDFAVAMDRLGAFKS